MHFSVFLTSRSDGPRQDRPVMQAMIRHAEDAHRLGYDAIFLPDHHFTGYAPPASDPMMFASYLAARLPDMYFGFSVQTIPLHHPVRFAERLNLLDQLTDGRILVGIGSGTTPEEMIGLGVNYRDTAELSVSNLAIVEQLWEKKPGGEPVVFDNGHYRGAVVSRIVPAAYSTNGPQIMSVALRPSSTQRAAEQGQPAFIPAFTPPSIDDGEPMLHLQTHFTTYRDALLAAGHPDEVVNRALEWTTHTYQHIHLADSEAQAEDEFNTLMEEYQEAVEREHAANLEAERLSDIKLRPPPDARKPGYHRTWCLWGTPATVTEHLREIDELGIGNILAGFMGGPLTAHREEWGSRSLELFATAVAPTFRGAR